MRERGEGRGERGEGRGERGEGGEGRGERGEGRGEMILVNRGGKGREGGEVKEEKEREGGMKIRGEERTYP